MSNSTKTGAILADLWRRIEGELHIDTLSKREYLMNRWLNNPRNVQQNRAAKSSARNNLYKDLKSPTMTLKTFVKLMTFLSRYRFKIIIEIPHPNGVTTQHYVNVNVENSILKEDTVDNDDQE